MAVVDSSFSEDVSKLMGKGKRHLVCNEVVQAVKCFEEATQKLDNQYGSRADECGEAYLFYGKALLELARAENGVLGNALKDVEPKSGESSDDEEEKMGTVGPKIREMSPGSKDKIKEDVHVAMAEEGADGEENDNDDEKEQESEEAVGKDDEETMETEVQSKEESESKSEEPTSKEDDKRTMKTEVESKEESESKSEEVTSKADDEETMETEVESKEESERRSEEPTSKEDDKGKMETEVQSKEESESKSEEVTSKEVAAQETTEQKDSEAKEKENNGEEGKEGGDNKKEGEKDDNDDDDDDDDDDDSGGEEEEKEGEQEAKSESGAADAEEQEEDGDIPTMQLAWETLELARFVFMRHENKEAQLNLAEVHLKLGEIQLEQEQFESAITDFQKCLELQEKHLESDDRLVAETAYNLGLGYSLLLDYAKAKEFYSKALGIIQLRTTNIEARLAESDSKSKGKGKATDDDPCVVDRKELEELQNLSPEIKARVDDAQEMLNSAVNQAGSITEEGFGSSGQEKTDVPVNTIQVKKVCNDVPITDVSHLVRRKRKPEEESSTLQDENTETPVKKARQDEEQAPQPTSTATENGHAQK